LGRYFSIDVSWLNTRTHDATPNQTFFAARLARSITMITLAVSATAMQHAATRSSPLEPLQEQ
jgi:hypothetical protein